MFEVTAETLRQADQVRLLIGDNGPEDSRLFSNEGLCGLLELNPGSVRRAAAQALDTIAVTETLLSKKITSQDLSTDGPAVAEALRKLAASLREQADREEAAAATFFDIVDWPYGQPAKPELTEPSW